MFLPGQPRLPVAASITGLQEGTTVPVVPEPPAVWTVLTAGFAYCTLTVFTDCGEELFNPPLEFPSVQLR
jgi:hypothetical protein